MNRVVAHLVVVAGSMVLVPLFSQDVPVPPREAPLRMTLPDGFRATLFAGEPDVVQPIAFCFDDRGRLWVAECFSYPKWHADPKDGKDRITILDDTDGDGQFDKRTVFHDKIANVSGIEYGFGGVWLCATPNLQFIPDRNGDDVPDGPPEVVLDGWDLKAGHNVFNGLNWGPDGWLYGCNGILSNSKVGAPGAPEKERTALNCGVWRYHPIRKKFEAVAHGTTNPWGLDFDDFGQMFITNCVIHHLWHVVPGAHFERMFGQDINPHSYGLIKSCADHIHWAGGHWTSSRGGKDGHSDTGGGHAHSGAMIYLGDNWPKQYRNGAFMCNIHGNRINHDTLERKGSTYIARHSKDFLFANDPWFRGLAVQNGPDGAAFVSDWSDTGECHNYQVAHKSSGRVFKIMHGKPAHKNEDLAKFSDLELVERQLHPNDWQVRHARRILQERAAHGKLAAPAVAQLKRMLAEQTDVTRQLRALWTLHCVNALDPQLMRSQLGNSQEHVRAWVIQLALENGEPNLELLNTLKELAQADPSPIVRLALASALQRLPLHQRWAIAERLTAHAEDAADPYLPLMLWYGVEPLVPTDPAGTRSLLAKATIPLVREYLTRRTVALGIEEPAFDGLIGLLGEMHEPAFQRDVLRGIQEGLSGRRDVSMPKSWQAVYPALVASTLGEVRERSLSLAVVFGDERAWKKLNEIVLDRNEPPPSRAFALQTLVFKSKPEVLPLLETLVADPALRGHALRSLAAFNSKATPALILRHYPSWSNAEKADAIGTLTSRPAFALELLAAVERGTVPRRDIDAFTVRQMLALKNREVTERVESVWGKVRPASEEKKAVISKFKSTLTTEVVRKADLANGRALYAKNCAACHRLFNEGGDVGPELTGSQRANLDYILENVVDPSAIVPREHQVTLIVTTNGRAVTGIVKKETEIAVTIQTPTEQIVIPKPEIETRTPSPLSMMPEGLLNTLRPDEVRDLIGYLASPAQVPLPK